MARLMFFSKDKDILHVTDLVESVIKICYYQQLSYRNSISDFPFKPIQSARTISGIGIAAHTESIACDGFLITLAQTPIAMRLEKFQGKSVKVPDFGNSPHAADFRIGGLWNGEVLIAGEIAIWGTDPSAHKIFQAFKAAMKSAFPRQIRGAWIGPAALAFLEAGGNLRQNAGPKDIYSLKIEEP
jgi:hypothetical protein